MVRCRDFAFQDLARCYAPGIVIFEYFRWRENRVVTGALIHHHRTFRRG